MGTFGGFLMGTEIPTEKDVWKYIPGRVARARAQVHMNRLNAAILEPIVALLVRLTRKRGL